jgi:hypothetical protein
MRPVGGRRMARRERLLRLVVQRPRLGKRGRGVGMRVGNAGGPTKIRSGRRRRRAEGLPPPRTSGIVLQIRSADDGYRKVGM